MKLKKIIENGTEYFIIEEGEKASECNENTQKSDTGWHLFADKVKNSVPIKQISSGACALASTLVNVATAGLTKANSSFSTLRQNLKNIHTEHEKSKKDDESLKRLVSLLPYASGECAAEIAKRIKAYPEALKRYDTHALLSKLDGDVRDGMFLYIVSISQDSATLYRLAPLVSSEAISRALELLEP